MVTLEMAREHIELVDRHVARWGEINFWSHSRTLEEQIADLKECFAKGKPMWELFPDQYPPMDVESGLIYN